MPPLIITVAHQKGGVGKSTLAINLAAYFNAHDVRTAIVDTDIQGSVTHLFDTFSNQKDYDKLKLIKRQDFKTVNEILELPYDLLVIDTPPYLSMNLKLIFTISHFVLIPTKPSLIDLLALDATHKLIESAAKSNPRIKTGIVMNMTTQSSDYSHEIRERLAHVPIPVLKSEIGNRIEFARCFTSTSSILGSPDQKAIQEIEALGHEILYIIKGQINPDFPSGEYQ